MTTLAELVNTPPAPTRGVPAGFVYGSGEWRHVMEVADPAEGSAVHWYDITAYLSGYDYNRGAPSYNGRYQSSIATIDLFADDDRLAPWNDFNMLGIELGPGLLIRSAFIRVDGGVVAEWDARFTNKVESWSDDSHSKGRVRHHTIVARDTLTSLVDVPIPERPEENWTLHLIHLIGDSGWPYGQVVYGAQFTSTGAPIKLLPERPASASAISELDAILDPVGLMWYTNQRGQLIIRPTVYDTFHAAAFAAGATGGAWIDPAPVEFRWDACMGGGGASYAVDTNAVSPFGLDKSELAVINHVIIHTPADGSILDNLYDDDNPISIQRYDRKSMQATWIAPNNTAAGDLLAYRAKATVEARPLTTTMETPGFFPGPAHLDYGEPITIVHRNRSDGPEVTATGFLRSYRERIVPRGCDTNWSLEITVDIGTAISAEPPPATALLPVEDLTITVQTDTTATFTWTNPAQAIAPTHTQIRMLDATSDWQTVEYPRTTESWAYLHPSNPYQFEVRLIRIVDGVVTHFSPIRSLPFYTLDPASPWVDVGDDGLIIYYPPSGTCSVGWELEQSPTGLYPWTVIDSGTEPPGTPTAPYDEILGLDPTAYYRWQSWEICLGVPQPRHPPSNIFVIACVPISRVGIPPYDDPDLVAYWPEICPDNITEAVSNTPMELGNAFAYIDFDDDGNLVMASYGRGTIGSGPSPISPLTDLTIGCRVMIGELPVSQQTLFIFDGLLITASPDAFHSGKFIVSGRHYSASTGSLTTITGVTPLDLDTMYDFVLTNTPTTADMVLFVNGAREGSSISAGARATSPFTIGIPGSSWITDCAVWDRVLADDEVPGIPPVEPGLGTALVLYDIRGHTSGALVNSGSLGSAYNLTDLGGGEWSLTVTGAALAAWGGPPSSAPWTFMFKVNSGSLPAVNTAFGGVYLSPTSHSTTKFIFGAGDVSTDVSSSYVRMSSDTTTGTIDMEVIQSGSATTYPGSLFFMTVDFANPTGPPGLQMWRNGVDETAAPATDLLYGSTATPSTIDAAFADSLHVNIQFTSETLGLTGMGLFRGAPTSEDLATWADYWPPPPTVPVYKAAGTAATATATDRITVPLPTGWAAGDFCIVAVTLLDNVTGQDYAASGWTRIARFGTGVGPPASIIPELFKRVLQTGDTNPTFIYPGGGSWSHVGQAFAYTGVNSLGVGYFSKTTGDEYDSTPTAQSTGIDKSIMVSFGNVDFYQPLLLKSGAEQGFTVRGTANLTGQGGFTYADKVIPTSGSVTFPTYRGPQFSGNYFFHVGLELSGESAGRDFLANCTAWWDARDYTGTGDLHNKGTSGAALDLTINGPTFASGKFTFDGVNDYMRCADHADLNFDVSDSFHIGIIARFTATPTSYGVLMTKRVPANSTGWLLMTLATNVQADFQIVDSFLSGGYRTPAVSSGTAALNDMVLWSGCRDVAADTLTAFRGDTASTPVTDTTLTSLSSTSEFCIGRVSGSGGTTSNYQGFEFYGAFVNKGSVFTTAQLLAIAAEYGI